MRIGKLYEKISHEAHPFALPNGRRRCRPHHYGNKDIFFESISSRNDQQQPHMDNDAIARYLECYDEFDNCDDNRDPNDDRGQSRKLAFNSTNDLRDDVFI